MAQAECETDYWVCALCTFKNPVQDAEFCQMCSQYERPATIPCERCGKLVLFTNYEQHQTKHATSNQSTQQRKEDGADELNASFLFALQLQEKENERARVQAQDEQLKRDSEYVQNLQSMIECEVCHRQIPLDEITQHEEMHLTEETINKLQSEQVAQLEKLEQLQAQAIANIPRSIDVYRSNFDELKDDEKQAVVSINPANDKTQTHMTVARDTINALSNTLISIDLNFIEKSDSHVLTTFCEIMGQLGTFLNDNNKQLLKEIPIVMKPQLYEPCNDDDIWISSDLSVRKKINDSIWNPLNDGINSFLVLSNKFVDMRDEFIIILGYIMWKPSYFETDDAKETIKKFESLNNKFIKSVDNDGNKEKTDVKENEMLEKYKDCFNKFHGIQSKLPGSESFDKLIEEIPKMQDKINHFIDNEYNKIIDEHNSTLKTKQSEIKTKINQLNNLQNEMKKIYDNHIKAHNEKNASESNRLGQLYKQKEVEFNALLEKIKNMQKLLKAFSEKFENEKLKEMDKKLDDMRKERQEMIDGIEKVKNETGIKYHNIISKFILSIEEAQSKSMCIAQRIVQFETLLSTLIDIGKRSAQINMINGNESPTIEWYFSLKQIGFESMVKYIHELSIKTIKELKSKYDSKSKCKDELIPYLEDKLERKLKLGEKRKLIKICTVDIDLSS